MSEHEHEHVTEARVQLEKARAAAQRPADGQSGEWALVDLAEAEQALQRALDAHGQALPSDRGQGPSKDGPILRSEATPEQVEAARAEVQRREQRRRDALVLKTILAQHHESGRVHLDEDDRRAIAEIAWRLLSQPAPTLEQRVEALEADLAELIEVVRPIAEKVNR